MFAWSIRFLAIVLEDLDYLGVCFGNGTTVSRLKGKEQAMMESILVKVLNMYRMKKSLFFVLIY
jgi:hypothetical protein